MKLHATLEANIVSWVTAITGLECVAEQEKYRNPKPSGDFASYNILAPIKRGSDEVIQKIHQGTGAEGDVYTVTVLRYVPINVTIYAEDALKKGLDLQMSLSRPTVWETYFSKAGFGFIRDEGLSDISAVLETGFEKRSLFTVIVSVPFKSEDIVGYIDELKGLKGTIKDVDGSVVAITEQNIEL